jgi:multicomponent Na+:H+ antiporter subunit C
MFEFLNQSEMIKTIVTIGSMALFFVGLFGLLSQRHIIKIFMSIAIMEVSLFLFFLGLTFNKEYTAPIVDSSHASFIFMNDPIPHAMILTAIVIGMAVLALGVSFAIEYYKLTGKNSIDEMQELRH